MRLIATLLLVPALLLSACNGAVSRPQSASDVVEAASDGLARVEAGYARLRAAAEIVLPFLPPERAVRVRAGLAIADKALAAARIATSTAEQLVALGKVEDAGKQIEAAAKLAPISIASTPPN